MEISDDCLKDVGNVAESQRQTYEMIRVYYWEVNVPYFLIPSLKFKKFLPY